MVFQYYYLGASALIWIQQRNSTTINISLEWYRDDQFILASQAKQVLYISDLLNYQNWKVVVNINHRHISNIPTTFLQ